MSWIAPAAVPGVITNITFVTVSFLVVYGHIHSLATLEQY
jgi:hypothetical protein